MITILGHKNRRRGKNLIHWVVVNHHVDGRSLKLRTATTNLGFGGLGAPRRFSDHNMRKVIVNFSFEVEIVFSNSKLR
jgi:hypothetical protein